MDFKKKIQGLSLFQRKLILWTAMVAVGLIFFIFWIRSVQKAVDDFPAGEIRGQFRLPLEMGEGLRNLPELELPELEAPEISEQEWQELEKELSQEEIEELRQLLQKQDEKQEKKQE